jgi:hypothetical protein
VKKASTKSRKLEKQYTEAIACNHCTNNAPMLIITNHTCEGEDELAENLLVKEGHDYQMLECLTCQRITLRSLYWHEAFPEAPRDYMTIFPVTEPLPKGLPQAIKKEFEAALRVRTINPGSYAVLIRRMLEQVCKDRKAAGKNLNQKLDDLVSKNEIPIKLADVAHKLRMFGNMGAHAADTDVDEADVPILDDLSRALLEYVYGAPFLVEQAAKRLAEKKPTRTIH